MKNKLVAIIQARQNSKRLPNKALLSLGGVPMIVKTYNRLKAVNVLKPGLIKEIVVAIPKGKAHDELANICKLYEMECFRGSEKDVLDRVYQCAKKYKADKILRITGDCPLIEPIMIIGLIERGNMPYNALAFNRKKIPGGWDAELFDMSVLKEAWKTAKEREHFTKEMRWVLQDYMDFGTDFEFDVSLEVNTKADYRKVKKYAELL